MRLRCARLIVAWLASLGASEIIIDPNETLVSKPRPADQQLNSDLGISAATRRLPLTPLLQPTAFGGSRFQMPTQRRSYWNLRLNPGIREFELKSRNLPLVRSAGFAQTIARAMR